MYQFHFTCKRVYIEQIKHLGRIEGNERRGAPRSLPSATPDTCVTPSYLADSAIHDLATCEEQLSKLHFVVLVCVKYDTDIYIE